MREIGAGTLHVKVAQFDAVRDVALLKIEAGVGGKAVLPDDMFMDENAVEVGATIAYIGYPFSHRGLTVRHIASATLASKIVTESGIRQFQLDAMVHEGCSGGPAIDANTGKIIGILSGRFSPVASAGGFAFVTGGHVIGGESSISYATSIAYGLDLMKAEGLSA
ncbi:hypothetical protein OR16_31814 [Cupriavidus basilensis OR16]|uniref:Serine protease n=2 Tax=Cupriavidus basilensis TaxID=68895 RepID=H1SDI6_9BURK|nr:hypothetical protein OR16_31814 [Cupriavidus basilensis OR16]